MDQADEYILKDNVKSLQYARKANALAEKTNNSRIKCETYLQMASRLEQLGFNKESLLYIEKGLKQPAAKNEIEIQVLFKEMRASNYLVLGLYDQELKEYSEILDLVAHKEDNIYFNHISSRINARLSSFYLYKKEYKYAEKYINKSIGIYEKFSKENNWMEITDVYLVKGYVCYEVGKKDSAVYYYNKSYQILKNSDKSKSSALKAFGEYFYKEKKYLNAISAYKSALNDMKKYNVLNLFESSDFNHRISIIYGLIGDKKNEKVYLDQYLKEYKKLQDSDKKSIQVAVNGILKEQNQENEDHKSYLLLIVGSIIGVSLIVFFALLFRYRKANKLIKNQLSNKENQLIINTQYAQELEGKLQISLDEVLSDAKNNSPLFFEKFQLLYPDFRSKLLDVNPTLTASDLVLLAYIYLNLNSKEIAEYTFRSFRTIQTRKYNLRKKLGLSSDNDFYVELKKIV
ncbi:tetratricopeptide repeat protein [Chryseobacterium sp. Mn2064]|uniref:tetratricopeptide repeat protein n=1 Tax=Chryseobacterium sp. Mn2064 TaxID=3395263 RepID=UPI003BE21A06